MKLTSEEKIKLGYYIKKFGAAKGKKMFERAVNSKFRGARADQKGTKMNAYAKALAKDAN